jgi:hypothetical protein
MSGVIGTAFSMRNLPVIPPVDATMPERGENASAVHERCGLPTLERCEPPAARQDSGYTICNCLLLRSSTAWYAFVVPCRMLFSAR